MNRQGTAQRPCPTRPNATTHLVSEVVSFFAVLRKIHAGTFVLCTQRNPMVLSTTNKIISVPTIESPQAIATPTAWFSNWMVAF